MPRLTLIVLLLVALVVACRFGGSNVENNRSSSTSNEPENSRSENLNAANSETAERTPKPIKAAENAVCPDPKAPCQNNDKHFDEWELSFKMPAKLTPNKVYTSAPFWAIVVKTYDASDDCDAGEFVESIEADRKRLQTAEPTQKAFVDYQCPNMGAVGYEFSGLWDEKHENRMIGHFLAIYAGQTRSDAVPVFEKLRAKYPDAQMKQMTVNYEWLSM